MSQDTLVTKPASGHWTDAHPELGRGPVSLEDCVSEEFYEKERQHVFKKTWLYVGRAERVPKSGSYFTRELKFLNTSVIVVRGKDGDVRVLSAVCQHRGMVLAQGAGTCTKFTCPYHHWSYGLDGRLLGTPAMERAVEGFANDPG